jgi:hypothetical protein
MSQLLYLAVLFTSFSLLVNAQCETGSEVTLTLNDSYGDTWNGNTLTINDVIYDQPSTSSGGASDSYEVCIDLSVCTDIIYTVGTGFTYPIENSWSISDSSGVLAAGADTDGLIGGCVSACADETADNYNADADIVDNTLCLYSLIQGCMDESACNYDMLVEQDNGSCEFPPEGFDCEANCTSGTLINVTAGGGTYDGEITWGLTLGDSAIWFGYATGLDQLCLTDDYYTLEMFDSFGDGWNGAQIAFFNDTTGFSEMMDVELTSFLLDGFPATVPVGDFASLDFIVGDLPTLGCTDSTAFNYDSTAGADDGSCIAVSTGCTDPVAENYDETSNTDDGSCTYVLGCIDNTAVNFAPAAT